MSAAVYDGRTPFMSAAIQSRTRRLFPHPPRSQYTSFAFIANCSLACFPGTGSSGYGVNAGGESW